MVRLILVAIMLLMGFGVVNSQTTGNNSTFAIFDDCYSNHVWDLGDMVICKTIDGVICGYGIYRDNNIDPDITTLSIVFPIFGFDGSNVGNPLFGDTLLYSMIDNGTNDFYLASKVVFKDLSYTSDGNYYVTDGIYVVDSILWENDLDIVSELSHEILIYPNPVVDGFYVVCGKNDTRVDIFDINGSWVYGKNNLDSGDFILMNKFRSGVYYIRIDSDKISYQKLIKL